MTNAIEERNGYVNHEGFGGLVGQRSPFSNAATEIDKIDNAASAIKAAGLDFTVAKRPLWFTGTANGSKPLKVEDAFAMVVDGEDQYLATVGKAYTPIQNSDAFGWADLVPGTYVAGGSLRKRRNVYLIKELADGVFDAGGDSMKLYLFLRNSHDGTKALSGMVTPVRVRCMNMTALALSQAKVKFSVRHCTSYEQKLEQAVQVAGLVDAYAKEFKDTADKLASIEVQHDEFRRILEEVMPRRTELQDGVMQNLELSNTIAPEQRRTAWGALNAVTEFFEWGREVDNRSNALGAVLDGQGARVRQQVARRLLTVR